MLASGERPQHDANLTIDDIEEARKVVEEVNVSRGMLDIILKLRNEMQSQGVNVTDRTYKRSIRILQAEAFLNGRDEVQESDFDVLADVYWTDPENRRRVYTSILDLVAPEKGKIVELHEKAKEVAQDALGEKDERKRSEKGIEAAAKLKSVKKEMKKYTQQMERKEKDTAEVEKMLKDLDVLTNRVFSEACGIDFD